MIRNTRDGVRQTGYAITIAIVLLALFCLLAGDKWAAATLALGGGLSMAVMEMLRKGLSRRL